jgi:hypothetical protein
MVGDRAYNFFGNLVVKDPKNKLYADIVFNINAQGAIKSLISYGASFLGGRNGASTLPNN